MPCRIYLRKDQSSSQIAHYSIPNHAKIFAPTWVRSALQTLGERLSGTTFEVYDNPPPSGFLGRFRRSGKLLETLKISQDFNNQSLQLLQKVARNEPSNVTGKINFDLYSEIKEKEVIYSLRDLVRQCVIVGVDECSSYGGYGCRNEKQSEQRVYICDLAALQFQQEYNTGRLILIQKKNPDKFKGILDDVIFQEVVGEKKRTFEEVSNLPQDERENRYIFHGENCIIDAHAYKRFVSRDVVLSGLALSEMASARGEGDQLNFKFLKYGTGFFAGKYQAELESLILSGVMDGLEELFALEENSKVRDIIKRIELPFYNQDLPNAKRIEKFKARYQVSVFFSHVDALKNTTEGFKVATTNCGDNHAVCGNEMGFSSVDAAIAENLKSKGNLLCPNINTKMDEEYLDIPPMDEHRKDFSKLAESANDDEEEVHYEFSMDVAKSNNSTQSMDAIPCQNTEIGEQGSTSKKLKGGEGVSGGVGDFDPQAEGESEGNMEVCNVAVLNVENMEEIDEQKDHIRSEEKPETNQSFEDISTHQAEIKSAAESSEKLETSKKGSNEEREHRKD